MTGDHLRLVLPADPAYGRIARITASNLALRLGFGYDEIEDLRIAMDELVILLLRPEGDAGTITLDFVVTEDGLTIDGATTAGSDQPWADTAAVDRFTQIVGPTVDDLGVEAGAAHAHLAKHLAGR